MGINVARIQSDFNFFTKISQKRLEKSGFLLNLISELPNMFLSKISFRA
jgi:hypothetical protein